MIHKKAGMLAVVIAGAFLLGGCEMVQEQIDILLPQEEEWAPEQTSLDVREDGSMTETILQHLDQSYYDTEELSKMIAQTVQAYNGSAEPAPITIDEQVMEGADVTLTMSYAAAEDYAAYNNVVFFNGSMLNAQMEGFLFGNDFKKVSGGATGEEMISNEEPLSHKECQVLVTDTSHVVYAPGKVLYCSANASVRDGRIVVPAPAMEQEVQGLVLPSSTVYVEAQGEISSSDKEKTYVYIIYEE